MSDTPAPMPFVDAAKKARFADQLTNDELAAVWKAHASMISYYHADDSGREWGEALKLQPTLKALDEEHDRRGIARPKRAGWLL